MPRILDLKFVVSRICDGADKQAKHKKKVTVGKKNEASIVSYLIKKAETITAMKKRLHNVPMPMMAVELPIRSTQPRLEEEINTQ